MSALASLATRANGSGAAVYDPGVLCALIFSITLGRTPHAWRQQWSIITHCRKRVIGLGRDGKRLLGFLMCRRPQKLRKLFQRIFAEKWAVHLIRSISSHLLLCMSLRDYSLAIVRDSVERLGGLSFQLNFNQYAINFLLLRKLTTHRLPPHRSAWKD